MAQEREVLVQREQALEEELVVSSSPPTVLVRQHQETDEKQVSGYHRLLREAGRPKSLHFLSLG